MRLIEILGLIASVALPFWNIPLIIRISHRRSSKDVSVWWAFGIMACLLLMLPAGLVSSDPIFKVFAVMNALFFAAVVVQVVRYR